MFKEKFGNLKNSLIKSEKKDGKKSVENLINKNSKINMFILFYPLSFVENVRKMLANWKLS